jgi:hypothetical protein
MCFDFIDNVCLKCFSSKKNWVRCDHNVYLSSLMVAVSFLWLCSPARATASSYHEVSWSHTTTRHSRDSSGREISSSQRPLFDNTQQKNIHAPLGFLFNETFRTHNHSRQAAVDLRLRPRGHWDRRIVPVILSNFNATRIFSKDCGKSSWQISWKPVQWKPSFSIRKDGWTNRHNEANNEPQNWQ